MSATLVIHTLMRQNWERTDIFPYGSLSLSYPSFVYLFSSLAALFSTVISFGLPLRLMSS